MTGIEDIDYSDDSPSFLEAAAVSEIAQPNLALAFARLLRLLVDAPDLDVFLDEVVWLAAAAVTTASACGLTMRHDGRPFTVASSGELASKIDQLQYEMATGPCLQALETGVVVQVDDLTLDQRWPEYRDHAILHGVLSSLSLPLNVDGQNVGALNLYAERREAFQGESRQLAEAFTEQCSAALALSLRQSSQAELHRQLTEAMSSRSVIDHAIGIMMAQQRCNAAVAFDLLRQASQHRNRRLRDLAADIVAQVSGERPDFGTGFHDASRRKQRPPRK